MGSKVTSACLCGHRGDKFPSSTSRDDDPWSRRSASTMGTKNGVKLENFPPAMSSAPFKYIDGNTGKTHDMAFMGGVAVIVQHRDTGAIEPKMGWAVMDSGKFTQR